MLNRNRLLLLLGALLLTFCIRVLTLQFMRAHLNDPGWFQVGSYAKFDRQARDILDGKQRLFWIDDPARTDLVQHPPALPMAVALIYKLSGDRSAYAVQSVQWIADLGLMFVLVTGVAATAFGPRAGVAASYLFAFSPLFAMYGAYPSADAPATWFVLGGAWVLLLAAKRSSVWLALGAGVLLGIACWLRVNPLYLCVGWAVALLLFTHAAWRRRLQMSAAALLGTLLVIAPIVVRNYLMFPDFTPTGGTIGTNLWEGLGETEFGRQNGFLFGDDKLIEHERVKMGWPADGGFEMSWPDGIRRDRERTREALDFIKQHPIWYSGVMLGRMWGMLKVALYGHHRNQCDEQEMFAAGTARERARVCGERAGDDPKHCTLPVSAVGGARNVRGAAAGLAGELHPAGNDSVLSRARYQRAHGNSLRAADARTPGCIRGLRG
jgi:hypothetical protein